MLEKMFPKQLNNDYAGSLIARWVFVLLTAVTLVRSLIHIFSPDGGAQSIATIPIGWRGRGNSDIFAVGIISILDRHHLHRRSLALSSADPFYVPADHN